MSRILLPLYEQNLNQTELTIFYLSPKLIELLKMYINTKLKKIKKLNLQ